MRDCDNRAHARDPKDSPCRFILATWVFPRRRECWDGSQKHHAQARHDSEDRIAEDLPEGDSENRTAKTELVELCPTWSSVLKGKNSDHPRAKYCPKNLTINGILEEHSSERDYIQGRPDDP